MQRLQFLVFSALLLTLSVFGFPSALAQSRTAIGSLNGSVTLNTDGSVAVEQAITYSEPAVLSWTIFSPARDLTVLKEGQPTTGAEIISRRQGEQLTLGSLTAAQHWTIRYNSSSLLIRHDARDQMYYKIIEEPGTQVYNINVTFKLPGEATESPVGNLYTYGGVLDPITTTASQNEIRYTATFAGPKSILTISANWPKTILELSPIENLRLTLLDLEIAPWLVVGLLLPILSLLVLLQLFWRQKRTEPKVTSELTSLPNTLSPLIVGVIVNKKIYPHVIVALLVDLCQRGYIVIVKKGSDYYLSPRKQADNQLLTWEKEILDQLFAANNAQVNEKSFKGLTSQSLFSPKVRDAFSRIYEVITDLEIFAENPHLTRVRYKLFALFLYFFGMFGVIWTVITGSSPYLLTIWAGTMAIAYTIIRVTPKLIRYTSTGQRARSDWLAVANFMRSKSALPIEASQNHTFERYLAYAIALNITEEWAGRFDDAALAIIKPDWFISYTDGSTVELVAELVEFTGHISKQLSTLRGPMVN